MVPFSRRIALVALLCLPGVGAEAAYLTTLTPTGSGLDGIDRLEIAWDTEVESGEIDIHDLSRLKFQLFGSSGIVIVEDTAIVGGVARMLGDQARGLDDMVFDFDLDAFAIYAMGSLIAFDNFLGVVDTDPDEGVLGVSGDYTRMSVVVSTPEYHNTASGPTSASTFVPLPASGLLLAGAFGLLGGAAQRRRRVSAQSSAKTSASAAATPAAGSSSTGRT